MRASRRSRATATIAAVACLAALFLASQTPRLILQWHLREVEYWRSREKDSSETLLSRPYALKVVAGLTGHPAADFFSDRASDRLQYHIQALRDARIYSYVVLRTPTTPVKQELEAFAASLDEEHLIGGFAMYPLIQKGVVTYLSGTSFDGMKSKVRAIRQWAIDRSIEIIEEFNCD